MITLLTTHCPKCKVLKMKLDKKNIKYTENSDVQYMLSKGLESAPALEVDGQILKFKEATEWINNYKEQ